MINSARWPLARLQPVLARPVSPPRWLTLFALIGGALASTAITRGFFDPDYFWHLAIGRRILETGAIPVVEPFSFTWRGDHWIPDQWLAEVLIAGLVKVAGGTVLLMVFGVIAATGPALVAFASRRAGALRLAVICLLVGAVLVPQVTARPQVVSFAMAGAVLAVLTSLDAEHPRRIWFLPVVLALWANMHGYFLAGLAAVAVYAGFTLIGTTPMSTYRGRVLLVTGACFLATTLTPQGPAGLLYAASFMDATDFGTRAIAEWQSPDFHSAQFLPFLGLIVAAVFAGTRRAPGWMQVLAVAGICAGLFAARATGIGAILAMPALLTTASHSVGYAERDHEESRRWMEFAAASLVAVFVVAAAIGRGPVDVDGRRVPVAGTSRLEMVEPDARVLADYAWGGYVISELSESGGTVFVDGRMHKFRPDVMSDYLRIVDGGSAWRGLVEDYGVEAILLPPSAPLVSGIAQGAGWCEELRTAREVLLLRRCGAEMVTDNPSVAGFQGLTAGMAIVAPGPS